MQFIKFYAVIAVMIAIATLNGLTVVIFTGGVNEFLEAWLSLLEKLVNTKNVLESPHTIQEKAGVVSTFKPLQFVISMQKVSVS